MIGLLAFISRTLLLAVFTFGFVVLYEHGPANFVKGAPAEWQSFASFVKLNTGVDLPAASAAGTPAPTTQP